MRGWRAAVRKASLLAAPTVLLLSSVEHAIAYDLDLTSTGMPFFFSDD
jgi:hypothetical protein